MVAHYALQQLASMSLNLRYSTTFTGSLAKIMGPTSLTEQEEQTVLDTLLYFADRGVPFKLFDVVEAISLLVENFLMNASDRFHSRMELLEGCFYIGSLRDTNINCASVCQSTTTRTNSGRQRRHAYITHCKN